MQFKIQCRKILNISDFWKLFTKKDRSGSINDVVIFAKFENAYLYKILHFLFIFINLKKRFHVIVFSIFDMKLSFFFAN